MLRHVLLKNTEQKQTNKQANKNPRPYNHSRKNPIITNQTWTVIAKLSPDNNLSTRPNELFIWI